MVSRANLRLEPYGTLDEAQGSCVFQGVGQGVDHDKTPLPTVASTVCQEETGRKRKCSAECVGRWRWMPCCQLLLLWAIGFWPKFVVVIA